MSYKDTKFHSAHPETISKEIDDLVIKHRLKETDSISYTERIDAIYNFVEEIKHKIIVLKK